jgi:hypothetical protein
MNNLQNTWNNPYRVADKFYRYYHMGNTIYKKTQPTDADKIRSIKMEEQKNRQELYKIGREVQHDQLNERKAYREALEFSSTLTKRVEIDNKEKTELMATALRKTFINPSKTDKLPPVALFS